MVGRLCWGPTVGWCGLHTQSWAPCLRDGSRVQKELSHRWVPWIFWVPCQALAGDISFLWRNFVCTWSLLWRVAQSSDGLPLLVKVEDFIHFRTTSRAFASTKAERNTENGWRTVCFCLNHLNHSWGIGESFGAPLGASQAMIFACSNDLKMFDGVAMCCMLPLSPQHRPKSCRKEVFLVIAESAVMNIHGNTQDVIREYQRGHRHFDGNEAGRLGYFSSFLVFSCTFCGSVWRNNEVRFPLLRLEELSMYLSRHFYMVESGPCSSFENFSFFGKVLLLALEIFQRAISENRLCSMGLWARSAAQVITALLCSRSLAVFERGWCSWKTLCMRHTSELERLWTWSLSGQDHRSFNGSCAHCLF